ncbi:hypothetical protein DRO47_04060, partial [Candidatus Bathyarchaeota archaeon]
MKRSRIPSKMLDIISRLKFSEKVMMILVLTLTIFILGGGIYDLIYRPVSTIPFMGRYVFYYPYSINEQTLNESITVMIFYVIGTVGMILMYQSTKYTSSPRRAYATLLLGIVLFILGYGLTEVLYRMKVGML